MTTRIPLLVCLFAVGLFAVWLALGRGAGPQAAVAPARAEIVAKPAATPALLPDSGAEQGGVPGASAGPDSTSSGEFADLPPQQQVRENWRRARGYFTQSDYGGYATYDEDTLRELSRGGDILALDLFATALFAAGEDDRATAVLHLAAVHGSTAALTRLAGNHQSEVWRLDADQTAARRRALGRMLVYAEVAALRGDYEGVVSGIQELDANDIRFTPSELEAISTEAGAIYDELASERAKLGMRPFDNDTPVLELVTKGFMLAQLRPHTGWASAFVAELPTPRIVDPGS